MNNLGPDNAFWIDGEWLSWDDIPDEFWGNEFEFEAQKDEGSKSLRRLEYEAELKRRFPKADVFLAEYYLKLLSLARNYHRDTGRHLHSLYGDIGELYGAIAYGIRLHRPYAQGSDGRLGADFVEIKTITPCKRKDEVNVRLEERNFSKLLVVKIDNDFKVSGRLVDRVELPKRGRKRACISWDALE
jgi:hypothetical protein